MNGQQKDFFLSFNVFKITEPESELKDFLFES